MKKEYISPSIKLRKFSIATIICASLGGGDNGDGRPAQSKGVEENLIGFDSIEDED